MLCDQCNIDLLSKSGKKDNMEKYIQALDRIFRRFQDPGNVVLQVS